MAGEQATTARPMIVIGQRFGARVVVKQAISDYYGRQRWLVRCDCGREAIIYAHHLPATTHCVHCNRGNIARSWAWKRRKRRSPHKSVK